jgi:inosine-uridine nucleoside N-ribohydrolase
VVLRRQLAAQQDLSVVIVAVGFSTNLARLLESSPDESSELDGRRLVARKVKLLVNMAGDFLRTRPEFNVYNDPASAQAVFDRWPTPIVTSEWQVGTDLPFPGEALTAVADPAANPILEALKLHARSSLGVEFPYDQPSYDLSAALYAVEPDGGYLAVGEPGQVSVDSQGVTRFTPGGHGRHQLIERPPDTATRDRIIDRYLELVAMVPDGETST